MTMRKEATPPQIITAEDILTKMRAGTRLHHIIRLRDAEIPVRVLSIDEMNSVRREAVKLALSFANGDEVDKNVEIQKTTLKLASTPHPGGVPLLSDKVLKALSVDELNYLYEEYVKVMDDVNPAVERMTDEKVRELVEAVKKSHVSAKDLSLLQLRTVFSLFQDLIQRLDAQRSQTAN